MSDQDIRNQLEGLFSDITPEPDAVKGKPVLEEGNVGPAEAHPAEGKMAGLEGTSATEEVASPITERASQGAVAERGDPTMLIPPAKPASSFPSGPSAKTPSQASGPLHAWANLSMRVKFIFVFLAVTLLTVVAVALPNITSTSAALTEQASENLEDLAFSEAKTVADVLVRHVEAMQGFGQNQGMLMTINAQNEGYSGTTAEIQTELSALDEAWMAASDDDPLVQDRVNSVLAGALQNLKDVIPDFAEAFLTDRYGGLMAASDRTSDYYQADEGWWQAAYNDGQGAVFIAAPELDESTGVIGVDVAVPVFSQSNEVLGVLRTTVDATALAQRLGAIVLGETGGADLLVGEEMFEAHHEGHEGDEGEGGEVHHELDQAALARMQTAPQGYVDTIFEGQPALVGYATISSSGGEQFISDLGWKVLVHQAKSEALAAVGEQTRNSIVVALLIAGGALVTAVVMGQVLAKPITSLTDAVARFSGGEMNVRVEAKSGDEIGTLAQAYNNMADQLEELFSTIEQRVAERTRARMELAAQVGRRLSTVRDLDQLLMEAVELIRESFDLYHVQVYLTDPFERSLMLRSGTGEVGAELVGRGHVLSIGPGSINGTAAAEKRAVIVSDTSQSATFMPNPLLPETRSEMAVPLLLGGRAVGVLDLQSAQPGALSYDNLSAFEALAGQFAIAIHNASLFAETARARTALETRMARQAHKDWSEYLDGVNRGERIGYAYEHDALEPMAEPFDPTPPTDILATPIEVQGTDVGAIHIEGKANRTWTEAEVELVQSVARQVGQQAENLRLLTQAEYYRAQAEQATRRLTREGWQEYLETQATPASGFAYDLYQVTPLANNNGAGEPALAYALEVRGEAIGQLAIDEVEALDDEAKDLVISVAERLSAHIENLRLLGETEKRGFELQERTRELEASQRVTFAASERTSPEDLLSLVVNLIRDQFDLYHVQVYIVDEEQNAAVLRESTGYAGRQLLRQKHHIPLDHTALVTRAISAGEPVLVADVREDPNYMPNPLLLDTRAELVVPLKLGDRVMGVLDAQDRKAGRFNESTVALFQTMTDQIAFLFENSELVERITGQTEELTVFTSQLRAAADVAERMSTILDPERLLDEVVGLLQSRFGLYHAHVYLLDKETDQLVVRAGSGEVGKVLLERGHSIAIDMEKSLVARAARDRQPVSVDDVSLVSDFMPNPLLPDTRSELALPLIVGDEVLGVLDVQDNRPDRFTEADIDVFSTLVRQIAAALQNAGFVVEMQKTAERLREIDKLKSEFLASMSHELRTPLNSIIGFAEVLLMGISGELPPEINEDIQTIYDNGQHLLRIINDVLDLAKIEAGTMTLSYESIDVSPMLEEIRNKNAGLLINKSIEILVEATEDLLPVAADPLRLNQILNNLVSNAVKFTEEGAVTLSAFSDNGWVCIEVQDTGIGIREEDMDTIFERFRQADGSNARGAEGSGLGLAITRNLVEMHGGTLDVNSKVGEGSTFRVRLPMQHQEATSSNDSGNGRL